MQHVTDEDIVKPTDDYFVIMVSARGRKVVPDSERPGKYKQVPGEVFHEFFKADRYQVYGRRLRTETDPRIAKRWKTAEGAAAALARLLTKGTIRMTDEPVVIRYTRRVVERYEAAYSAVEACAYNKRPTPTPEA